MAGTLQVLGGSTILSLVANLTGVVPPTPTVTTQGTGGSTTWAYRITALSAVGETLASVAGQTTVGNATLSSTNKNHLSWTAVDGATGYNVYRTVVGTSPSTTGLITPAPITATTFGDTGIAASGALPTVDTSGNIGVGTITPVARVQVQAALGTAIYGNSSGNVGVQGVSGSSVGGYFTSTSGPALATGTGNVGIGTTTPSGLLSVGSGSPFQVSAAGAIAAATGITSSGPVTFSGFSSPGGPLFTNGSGQLAQVTAGTATQVLHGGTTPSFGSVSLTADVTGILPRANGGTGVSSAPTNSQLLIGNGSGFALAGLTGTSNQVTVTPGSGSVTLSLPQSIDVSSSPRFANVSAGPFSLDNTHSGIIFASGSYSCISFAHRGLASLPVTPAAGDHWVWYSALGTTMNLWTDVNTNILWILPNGSLGIGASPQKPLDIALAGGIRISRTDGLGGTPADNEIFFQDNGQIRSHDDYHRIIFDRANNIFEIREYGDIIFSAGASAGTRTARMTVKANGDVYIGTNKIVGGSSGQVLTAVYQ